MQLSLNVHTQCIADVIDETDGRVIDTYPSTLTSCEACFAPTLNDSAVTLLLGFTPDRDTARDA